MKRTALIQKHVDLNAKIVSFAGYEMPVQYSGVNLEHEAVRNKLGIFDVSHMGEFIVSGKKALALIQYATSNDASKLFPGKIQYSCLPNRQNGIVDDLLVYRLEEEKFMLVVNASNMGKDWAWLLELNEIFHADLEDVSLGTSLMAVQGPLASKALQSLCSVNLSEMEYYTFQITEFAGVKDVIVSATGYTGAGGFELYCENEDAEQIWDAVMLAGAEYGIVPAGLAARDTLRLEMGFCLYGNDINEHISPNEAGLGWITKYSKVFVNAEDLLLEKLNKPTRRLVGFEMVDRGIPRKDYKIVDAEGNEIGFVTSGTQSPSLKKAIGMGYVKPEFTAPDTNIFVEIRDKNVLAKVCKLPFYTS